MTMHLSICCPITMHDVDAYRNRSSVFSVTVQLYAAQLQPQQNIKSGHAPVHYSLPVKNNTMECLACNKYL